MMRSWARRGPWPHSWGSQARGLHGQLQPLGGELATLEPQPARPGTGPAQQRLDGGKAEGGAAVALPDRSGLGRSLDLAFGEDHSAGGGDLETVVRELERDAGGEVVGDRELPDPVVRSQQEDDFRRAGALVGPALARPLQPAFEGQDNVKIRGALHPAELERADHADLAAPGAERDEGIGHGDAAEVQLVRVVA
jgi:hypothetical protein